MADAHAVPHHDYHLVDPSPWPLVASIATTIMMIGAVVWMKGLAPADAPLGAILADGQKAVFFAGLAGVLYSMFGWWSDVIKESKAGDHTPVVSIGLRYGMILFIRPSPAGPTPLPPGRPGRRKGSRCWTRGRCRS
mgnify:CR=1 FL=1